MRRTTLIRLIPVVVLVGVVGGVLLGSSPRSIGDGEEYLVNASSFANLRWPRFTQPEVDELGPGVKWVQTRDGRFETVHFWFYPLLAAPVLKAGEPFGLTPLGAFVALNLACFTACAWVAFRSWTGSAALLVLGGPILWWLNKPHPEVFMFSLLGLMVAMLRTSPAASMMCAALASTQNPPVAALVPLVAVLYPGARARAWLLALAVAIAALHPAYYLWTIGQTTALIEGDVRLPPLERFLSVGVDPNIGLIPGAPLVALGAVVAFFWNVRSARPRELLLATITAAWLLFSFTQAININHGGTPSMSRYALWLIPLTLVVLPSRDEPARGLTRTLGAIAACSLAWSVVYFHPDRPEGHLEPTRLAHYLWTRHPGFNNPVPEIFAERLRHADAVNTLAATDGCEKVLIQEGTWPYPCEAQPLPAECAEADALCYGNREGERYRFVRVPRRGGYRLGWPPERGR